MVTEVDIRKMVEEIIRDMGRDAADVAGEKATVDKSEPQPVPAVPEKSADSDRTGARLPVPYSISPPDIMNVAMDNPAYNEMIILLFSL